MARTILDEDEPRRLRTIVREALGWLIIKTANIFVDVVGLCGFLMLLYLITIILAAIVGIKPSWGAPWTHPDTGQVYGDSQAPVSFPIHGNPYSSKSLYGTVPKGYSPNTPPLPYLPPPCSRGPTYLRQYWTVKCPGPEPVPLDVQREQAVNSSRGSNAFELE